MNCLVVTGVACPEKPWRNFLDLDENDTVIGLASLIQAARGANIKALAKKLAEKIEILRPTKIVAHDLGVTLCLLALLKVQRQDPKYSPDILLFNGAFRVFDVFKAIHPFLALVMPKKQVIEFIQNEKGELDDNISITDLRKLYAQIIFASLDAKASNLFKISKAWTYPFSSKVLILASNDDKFIPLESIEAIGSDFPNSEIRYFQYAHYPYGANEQAVLRQQALEFLRKS